MWALARSLVHYYDSVESDDYIEINYINVYNDKLIYLWVKIV